MSTLIFDRRTGPVRVVVTDAGQLRMLEGDRVVELKPRAAQRLAGQLVGELGCDLHTLEVAQALDAAAEAYLWEFGDREEHIAPHTLTASHRDMIADTVRALLDGGADLGDLLAATPQQPIERLIAETRSTQ